MTDSEAALQQFHLARLEYMEHHYFQAAALFRTGMALDKNHEDTVVCNLAEAYYHLGLYRMAADTLARVPHCKNHTTEELMECMNSKEYLSDDGLSTIAHHTFIRLKILSAQLRALYPGDMSGVRLLDIGGGAGYLACFLPEIQYVLADPSVNGISALNLPFQSNSFDCVVACHVLEHIEDASKFAFMDNLCSLARSHVVLLNPFLTGNDCADSFADEILQMGWEITGAPWAKEHLDSGVPSLGFIKEYTRYHQYPLSIAANNSYAFTALYVLMEHFALVANKTEEFKKINKVFNRMDPEMMSNASFPNDFTCVIDVRDQEKK